MSIGTIDRTPPPFFRQGPSALTKLVLCSALALFLMVADNRFTITRQLRAGLATLLYYPQQALLVPVQAVQGAGEYFLGLRAALWCSECGREVSTPPLPLNTASGEPLKALHAAFVSHLTEKCEPTNRYRRSR